MKYKKYNSLTKHHILSRSRGGEDINNILFVSIDYHSAYHKLFENLTPDEVILYLNEVWFTKGKFTRPLNWLQKHKRPQK